MVDNLGVETDNFEFEKCGRLLGDVLAHCATFQFFWKEWLVQKAPSNKIIFE